MTTNTPTWTIAVDPPPNEESSWISRLAMDLKRHPDTWFWLQKWDWSRDGAVVGLKDQLGTLLGPVLSVDIELPYGRGAVKIRARLHLLANEENWRLGIWEK